MSGELVVVVDAGHKQAKVLCVGNVDGAIAKKEPFRGARKFKAGRLLAGTRGRVQVLSTLR